MSKALIKKHEGLRLEAYPDPGSGGDPWTIGYGHTKGVKRGDKITEEQAEAFLEEDMLNAYSVVDRLVTVPLSNQQRDALCSFVFNVGGGAFGKSTLLKLLNQSKYKEAAEQLLRWTKAAGKEMPGLVKRRKEERALFLAGTDLAEEVFPQEKPMAPFLVAAVPALVQALPEFAKIFQKKDVSERNVEALGKAVELVVQATGATNVQEAVERIEADPQTAREANDILRTNRADLADLLERSWQADEQSIANAREFYKGDSPVYKKWHFVQILSMFLAILGGTAALWVLGDSDNPSERSMALQTLLLIGFGGVANFWLGSSRSSQVKDLVKDK